MMPATITHSVVSVKSNDPTKEVSSTAWNDVHVITGEINADKLEGNAATDFEAAGAVATHEVQDTGVHGAGASKLATVADISTHEGLSTGVHGVGSGTVSKVADIAVDGNLSAGAQDAISKRHTQNTDTGTSASNFAINGANAIKEGDSRLSDDRTPISHGNDKHGSAYTTLSEVKLDADVADAISKKHANTLDHSNALDHTQNTDTDLEATFEATFEKVANKGAISGYAPLDAGQKVPTVNLGGAGADATKYLRGDQTWQVPAGGSGLSHPQVMARLAMVM